MDDNIALPYNDKARESDESHSINEEYEGLVTGLPRPIEKCSFQALLKLLPALLIISLILNVLQAVYIGVRQPQCRSLYGNYEPSLEVLLSRERFQLLMNMLTKKITV